MPTTKKGLSDWLGYQEISRRTRERLETESGGSPEAFRRSWALWRSANPAPRMPQAFQWRTFVTNARREWTPRAETLLGHQARGTLGALLWSKVKPTEPGLHIPLTDRRSWLGQMRNSYQDALNTAREHLRNKNTLEERAEYLQTLPWHLAAHWEEKTWFDGRWQ